MVRKDRGEGGKKKILHAPHPKNLLPPPFALGPTRGIRLSNAAMMIACYVALSPQLTNLHSSECLFSPWLVTIIQQGSYLVWVDLDDHFLVGALDQSLVSILGHAQHLQVCRGNVFRAQARQ
jgi:hypothetical protein